MNKDTDAHPILEANDLTIGYGKRGGNVVVQQALNFSVKGGQLVCLIGLNGCGKSTLLRTLTGLIPPLGGSFQINGKELSELSTEARSLLYSFVLTESVSGVGLTVFEVVSLGRNPYTDLLGKLRKQDENMICKSLQVVNLWEKKDSLLSELSDGERQRAMIAKALVQETKIIFLDEPTAHLDLANRFEIMLLLHRLSKEMNRCFLLSTHELELSIQIADRILLLDKNGGLKEGIPEELILEGTLQSIFNQKVLKFDPYAGLFRMQYPVRRKISMVSKSEGILVYWTRQALRRNNFEIVNDNTLRVTVDERLSQWIIDFGQESYSAGGIGEMLNKLNTIDSK